MAERSNSVGIETGVFVYKEGKSAEGRVSFRAGLRIRKTEAFLCSTFVLLGRILFGEKDVVHDYVDFCNLEADQVFYAVYDVATHGFGELGYGFAVLDGHAQVYGCFFRADFHGHAAGRLACSASAGNTLQ